MVWRNNKFGEGAGFLLGWSVLNFGVLSTYQECGLKGEAMYLRITVIILSVPIWYIENAPETGELENKLKEVSMYQKDKGQVSATLLREVQSKLKICNKKIKPCGKKYCPGINEFCPLR